jgi:hypothetical protein
LTLDLGTAPTENGTYYVTLTEENKAESEKSAALTVKAYKTLEEKLAAVENAESPTTVTAADGDNIENAVTIGENVELNIPENATVTVTAALTNRGEIANSGELSFDTGGSLTNQGAIHFVENGTGTAPSGTAFVTDLTEAFAGSDATLILVNNVTVSARIEMTSGTKTLDLAGNTVTGQGTGMVGVIKVQDSASLTIKGVSGSKITANSKYWTIGLSNGYTAPDASATLVLDGEVEIENTYTTDVDVSKQEVAACINTSRDAEANTQKPVLTIGENVVLSTHVSDGTEINFQGDYLCTSTEQAPTDNVGIGQFIENGWIFTDSRSGQSSYTHSEKVNTDDSEENDLILVGYTRTESTPD